MPHHRAAPSKSIRLRLKLIQKLKMRTMPKLQTSKDRAEGTGVFSGLRLGTDEHDVRRWREWKSLDLVSVSG